MFAWEEYVATTYSEVVAEYGDSGTTFKQAAEIATTRIIEAIERGDCKPDMVDVVKRQLKHADSQSGKRGDKLVSDFVNGRQTLFDCEEDLNTVVILGDGERKCWRHINEEDLEKMDDARFRNLRNAQDSYNIWREDYVKAKPVLRKHNTVERAIRAGAFEVWEETA